MAEAPRNVWTAVARLIDSTDDVAALKANRLHLLAARRWRELGKEVPDELAAAERFSALVNLVLADVLARLRAAFTGPLVVHKGPEIALRYPDPVLRPYIDVDVLVADAAGVQQAFLEAGFVEVGNPVFYEKSPHRRPLEWPGLPLLVEVHSDLNWPSWLARSPTRELLADALPSALGVEGVDTLAPTHHALAVAAHAWAHGPFARVGDLVDVAAMTEGLDPAELDHLARRWGLEGLWRTTRATVDAVLFDGPPPRAVRTWARNLPALRERTVLETHLGRWLAGFSALGAGGGLRVLIGEIGRDLQPEVNETWGQKLSRVPLALRNAFVRRSVHDEEVDRAGRR